MESENFAFLNQHYPDLARLAGHAETYCHSDPEAALTKLRQFCECLVELIAEQIGVEFSRESNLGSRLNIIAFRQKIPGQIWSWLNQLRRDGNSASHFSISGGSGVIGVQRALDRLREAHSLTHWFFSDLKQHNIAVFRAFNQPPEGGIRGRKQRQERNILLKELNESKRKLAANESFFRQTETEALARFQRFEPVLTGYEDLVIRRSIVSHIEDFIAADGTGTRTLVIHGEPGSGKSALFAQTFDRLRISSDAALVFYIYHSGEGWVEARDCLITLYAQLVHLHGIEEAPALNESDNEVMLQSKLEALLKNHVAPRLDGRTQIILIDGLDEARRISEVTAFHLMPQSLPSNVRVIATCRTVPADLDIFKRRKGIQFLDIQQHDLRRENTEDARELVEKRLGDKVSAITKEEIVRFSNGNFLVLTNLCRLAQHSFEATEIEQLIVQALETDEESKLALIYRNFWGRIPTAARDHAAMAAALFVCVSEPVTDGTAMTMLNLGRAAWEIGRDAIREYLSLIKVTGKIYYRVYHKSFADFLKSHIESEIQQVQKQLAEWCCQWTSYSGELQLLALRNLVPMAIDSQKWSIAAANLTDFTFLQARCREKQLANLIHDFELLRQHHPEWQNCVRALLERDRRLDQWCGDTMQASREWAAATVKYWDEFDGHTTIGSVPPCKIPEPPDTSELCNRLLTKDYARPLELASWPLEVQNLASFHALVIEFCDRLQKHWEALPYYAANCLAIGDMAARAKKLLHERHGGMAVEDPLVDLKVGSIQLLLIPTPGATQFAVGSDGRYAVTITNAGDIHAWDLHSGGRLQSLEHEHSQAIEWIILSVDGKIVLTATEAGDIRIGETLTGRQLHRIEVGCPIVTLTGTADLSILAVLDSSGVLNLYYWESTENIRHWPKPFEFVPAESVILLRLSQLSGVFIVFSSNERFQYFPLELNTTPCSLDPDSEKEEADPTENSRIPFVAVGELNHWWDSCRSPDWRMRVRNAVSIYVDENLVYGTESAESVHDYVGRLTADGRVLWMLSEGLCIIRGVDLRYLVAEIPFDILEKSNQETRIEKSDILGKYGREFWFNFHHWGMKLRTRRILTSTTPRPKSEVRDLYTSPDVDDEIVDSDSNSLFGKHAPYLDVMLSMVDFSVCEHHDNKWSYVSITSDSSLCLSIALPRIDRIGRPGFPFGPGRLPSERVKPEIKNYWNWGGGLLNVNPRGDYCLIFNPPNIEVWHIPSNKCTRVLENCHRTEITQLPDWNSFLILRDERLFLESFLSDERCQLELKREYGNATAFVPFDGGRYLAVVQDLALVIYQFSRGRLEFVDTIPVTGYFDFSRSKALCMVTNDYHLQFLDLIRRSHILTHYLANPALSGSCNTYDDQTFEYEDNLFYPLTHPLGVECKFTLRSEAAEQARSNFRVTPFRVFRYDHEHDRLLRALTAGTPLPGVEDPRLSARCPFCNIAFQLPDYLQDLLASIYDKYCISGDRSVFRQLAPEAWDNPKLGIQCPNCTASFKLNPYIC